MTTEESIERLTEVRSAFCDEVLEDVAGSLFSHIESFGIRLKSNEKAYQKDLIFVTEAIQALLHRYAKIPHFLHEVIESTVQFPEEQEAAAKAKAVKKKRKKKTLDT